MQTFSLLAINIRLASTKEKVHGKECTLVIGVCSHLPTELNKKKKTLVVKQGSYIYIYIDACMEKQN